MASQSSIDIDNSSRLQEEQNTNGSSSNNNNNNNNSNIFAVASPKSSIKSRLAPLDLPTDKIRSIKIREIEFNDSSKIVNPRESSSATSNKSISSTSSSSAVNESQMEINWRAHIEPLLSKLNTYFKGKRKI